MRSKASARRGSWRGGANSGPMNEVPPPAFPPPDTIKPEGADASPMEFYQQGMPEAGGDGMMKDVGQPAFQMQGSDSDHSMQETEQQEGQTRKRPWEKGTAGSKIKMKKKKVPGAKNLKIRRYVQPKNAVMCLNELKPGVTYTTEQEGNVGSPFCVSVEINNGLLAVSQQGEAQKYRGFGSSKQLAKQAAAEAALISFVKPPVMSGMDGPEEDKTPWATLASFAIYKLFNDWREGRVGMCPPPSQPYGTAIPPGFQAFLGQAHAAVGVASKEDAAGATAFTEAISAHLGGRPNGPAVEGKQEPNLFLQSTDVTKVPNPARQVPDNAAAMHPVMVLHQMKPGIQYAVTQAAKDNKPFFTVSAEVDGKQFTGEGPNVKKAKFSLAKLAIQELYDVESTFEAPSA